MDPLLQDSRRIIVTLANLFKRENLAPEFQVLSQGKANIEVSGYDNWNGGTTIYGIYCRVPLELYSNIELEIQAIEQSIKNKAETLFRSYPESWVGEVVISPELADEIQGKAYKISHEDLVKLVEGQKSVMVSVSTGGARIQNVNAEYLSNLPEISEALRERGLTNPNPYKDLWEWYGKWSDGSLPTYQSRRAFLSEMFTPLIETIKGMKTASVNPVFEEPTGWNRVDRSMGEIKLRLAQAGSEEQYQGIGLLARETLISLAQAVYDPDLHESTDGTVPSKTDAKRMLEAYISSVLPGKSNENIRRHAKASLDLANDLTHRRTADFRLAALCAESTNAVVNILSIISGRRDRE
ncbi:MAG TPA: hypothetical protein DEA26_10720 [Oceanospirillales bacterium]|nr:hypothetical protein [Oceanospirillaceae bacterium]HBS43145.1 hypothetical protein [Oceanospirillales bacterium]|tara:strand:+ start:894 stop:1952 length:1059 start_codon:yes stop_codon:yes gene_type:complete